MSADGNVISLDEARTLREYARYKRNVSELLMLRAEVLRLHAERIGLGGMGGGVWRKIATSLRQEGIALIDQANRIEALWDEEEGSETASEQQRLLDPPESAG